MIVGDQPVRQAVDQALESLDKVGAEDQYDALTRIRDECQRRLLLRPTEREVEVIRQIASGKTSKEIAVHLGVEVKTVQAHRLNLMKKLDLHNGSDVTRYAIGQGIVKA